MADDRNYRSYRTPEPRRAAEPPRASAPVSAGDPLAELARLIGQSDPFAEFGRNNARPVPPPREDYSRQAPPPREDYSRQAPPPREDYSRQAPPPREDYSRPVPPPREDYSRQPSYSDHDRYSAPQGDQQDWHDSSPEQRYASESPRYRDGSESSRYRDDSYGQGQDFAQSFGHDPRAREPHPDDRYADEQEDAYAPAGHRDQRYADDRPHAAVRHAAAHRDDVLHDDHRDDADHDDAQDDDAQHDEDLAYHDDEAPLEPHEDDMYDDAPRARRRGGLATALALIGCAMLGTAGAYAYRSYTGHPSVTQPPPVITADSSTPTKIVPVPADAGRAVQERLANAGKEQIISTQEEPVMLREPGTQAAPRVVLPAPVAPEQPSAVPAVGLTEPKRVKPIPYGPDGSELSTRSVGALPAPAPPAPASASSRPAPAPAPKAAAPAPSSGAPLSLQPQGEEPAPAPRSRQAVVAPPPARPAAEPSTGSTGGFVVQLSSQKSESEAQSAFKSLQAKFPDQLGDRQPIVRRADLGSKGVFYRTMVGPFASSQEAVQFCSSYKAAGGQCVVPSSQ